jgi:hypothetical protein
VGAPARETSRTLLARNLAEEEEREWLAGLLPLRSTSGTRLQAAQKARLGQRLPGTGAL